jgi:hypothetical protein
VHREDAVTRDLSSVPEDDDEDNTIDVWLVMSSAALGVGIGGYLLGHGGLVVAAAIMGLSIISTLAALAGHPPGRVMWRVFVGLSALAVGVVLALELAWALVGVPLIVLSVFASHTVRRQIGRSSCDLTRPVRRALRRISGVTVSSCPEGGDLPLVTNDSTGELALVGEVDAEAAAVMSSRAYRDFQRRWSKVRGPYAESGVAVRGVVVLGDVVDFGPLAMRDGDHTLVLCGRRQLRTALACHIHGAR